MRSITDTYRSAISDIKESPLTLVPVFVSVVLFTAISQLVSITRSCEVVSESDGVMQMSCHVSTGALAGMIVATIAMTLVVNCWFICLLTESLVDGETSVCSSLRMLKSRFLPYLGSILFMVGLLFVELFFGPFLLGFLGIAGFVIYLLVILVTATFMIFAPVASVYNELGPLEAVTDSFRLVRRRFFHILVFLIATFLLSALVNGLSMIFSITGLARLGFLSMGADFFQVVVLAAFTRSYAELAWDKYRIEHVDVPQTNPEPQDPEPGVLSLPDQGHLAA